jgi:hypothetical protein
VQRRIASEFLQILDMGLTNRRVILSEDEGEIRNGRVLIVPIHVIDLHALRHREGMGKRAFPPQGVGTPVFLSQS